MSKKCSKWNQKFSRTKMFIVEQKKLLNECKTIMELYKLE